jgi:cysteine sulfinate desulfinase/cysteine desulfurase-like protein
MLIGMGLNEKDALSTVRISFGKIHSIDQINKVIKEIINILQNNKKVSKHNG